MTPRELMERAAQARRNAYAPYSHFAVGAALLCADTEVFTGCNLENASYSPTMCAERVAFGTALAAGHRAFTAIAIVGGDCDRQADSACFPCGVCRQVMREFCTDDFRIYLLDAERIVTYTLGQLLPHSFTLEGNHHAHDGHH